MIGCVTAARPWVRPSSAPAPWKNPAAVAPSARAYCGCGAEPVERPALLRRPLERETIVEELGACGGAGATPPARAATAASAASTSDGRHESANRCRGPSRRIHWRRHRRPPPAGRGHKSSLPILPRRRCRIAACRACKCCRPPAFARGRRSVAGAGGPACSAVAKPSGTSPGESLEAFDRVAGFGVDAAVRLAPDVEAAAHQLLLQLVALGAGEHPLLARPRRRRSARRPASGRRDARSPAHRLPPDCISSGRGSC